MLAQINFASAKQEIQWPQADFFYYLLFSFLIWKCCGSPLYCLLWNVHEGKLDLGILLLPFLHSTVAVILKDLYHTFILYSFFVALYIKDVTFHVVQPNLPLMQGKKVNGKIFVTKLKTWRKSKSIIYTMDRRDLGDIAMWPMISWHKYYAPWQNNITWSSLEDGVYRFSWNWRCKKM